MTTMKICEVSVALADKSAYLLCLRYSFQLSSLLSHWNDLSPSFLLFINQYQYKIHTTTYLRYKNIAAFTYDWYAVIVCNS